MSTSGTQRPGRGRRRTTRGLLAAALAAAVAAVPATAGPAAAGSRAAPPVSYAALGDSYSAGVGTGRSDDAGSPCRRSSLAYPRLWAQAHPGDPARFLACSGARISAVRKKQVPQIPPDAGLVTVTMGGNDTGFASVVTLCTVTRHDRLCRLSVDVAKGVALTEVPVELALTLRAVHRRAPHARVVVLGYPRLFELGPCRAGIPSESRRKAINDGADLLDRTLAKTARMLDATFVDVRSRFAGHGVCAPADRAWINGPDRGADSYHPTATGQTEGYLAALTSVTG